MLTRRIALQAAFRGKLELDSAVLRWSGAMLALDEYLMREPLPLAVVHEAILDFCRDRADVCLFGAQALNLHTHVPRMTQDVDIMAERPETLAEELAAHLRVRFPHEMAARVRAVRRGDTVLGYRIYQSRTEARGGNRHLADVRRLDVPREHITMTDRVQYTDGKLTLAMKAAAAAGRSNQVKRLQDMADLARLMVALPDVNADELVALWNQLGSPPGARMVFEQVQSSGLRPETDDDSFY